MIDRSSSSRLKRSTGGFEKEIQSFCDRPEAAEDRPRSSTNQEGFWLLRALGGKKELDASYCTGLVSRLYITHALGQ
jgi:hypothetical protein